jgi:hypothetical protein
MSQIVYGHLHAGEQWLQLVGQLEVAKGRADEIAWPRPHGTHPEAELVAEVFVGRAVVGDDVRSDLGAFDPEWRTLAPGAAEQVVALHHEHPLAMHAPADCLNEAERARANADGVVGSVATIHEGSSVSQLPRCTLKVEVGFSNFVIGRLELIKLPEKY